MWDILQCAVQGRSHIKSNTPCQDKTYSTVRNDIYVIALADGAGSARLSHYGAETVTSHICSELTEKFDNYFTDSNGVIVKQKLIDGLMQVLCSKAEALECEIKDLASTLLFVAVKNDQFILAHIGDGVIGYLKNDELRIASQPENGEFVNTTVFTTSKDAIMSLKLIKGAIGEITGFVLMSDGTEVSLYHKKEHKLADVIKKIMQLCTFLPVEKIQGQLQKSFENVIIQATTDDCSIILLAKKNSEFRGYLQLSNGQKCELLKIHRQSPKKKIRKYDTLLLFLQNKHSLQQIAKKIHVKEKYVHKYVDRLAALNFVEKDGLFYQTILIMDAEDNRG